MSIYCTYNTIYTGDKMPPFYIGYSTVDKVKNGYHGTVSSRRYKKIWQGELATNPHLFETTIIAVYKTQSEAVEAERTLLESVQAHKNPLYINMSIGGKSFFTPSAYNDNNERREAQLIQQRKCYRRNKEARRQYYWGNRQEKNAKCREYYQLNKGRILEQQSDYYRCNKDKLLEYRQNNRYKLLEYQREYRKRNKL